MQHYNFLSFAMQVATTEIIQVIHQFLTENGFNNTADTLLDEIGSPLITTAQHSVEEVQQAIRSGNLADSLRGLSLLNISTENKIPYYLHIVKELIMLHEPEAASTVLRQTDAMEHWRSTSEKEYSSLEEMLSRSSVGVAATESELFPEGLEHDRDGLAENLTTLVTNAPSRRLLQIINDALKWKAQKGVLEEGQLNKEDSEFRYDLFLDTVVKEQPLHRKARSDGLPRKALSKIDMTKKSHAESGCFSPDGNYFVTGSIDGFIEVWNYNTGKLSGDFEYQKERKFMSCDTAVLSLCFSKNGSLLAAGTQSGQIKLFTFLTGKTVKIIEKAQSKGVISVAFLNDMSGVICGGFDGSIKLFGLKSGRVLKEFYGHTSYVSSLLFNDAGNALISASGDGFVRIWSMKTCSSVHKVRLDENETNLPPVLSVSFMPGFPSIIATATSRGIYLVDTSTGKTVSSMNLTREIIGFAVSERGILIAVTDDYQLYSFTKRKESFTYDQKMLMTIHETEMIGFTSNPKMSIIASFHEDGMLEFYSS